MNQEIRTQLEKYAESDLRLVRKQGDTILCQTKQGNVDIVYNEDKTYTVFSAAGFVDGLFVDRQILITGKKVEIKNYIVEELYNLV